MSALPTLTLYRMNGSCTLATHLLLKELSIPFTSVVMTFSPADGKVVSADGSISAEEYARTVHPNGLVPALKITDPTTGETTILTENLAILSYLAELVPERRDSLIGKTPLERATILSWLSFLTGSIHGQGYSPFWRPGRFINEEKYPGAKDGVVEGAKEKIVKYYAQIEGRLTGDEKTWAVRSESPTGVDFYLYVFWAWGMETGSDMIKGYPKWTALVKRLERRKGTGEVMKEEGLKLMLEGQKL